jgi:hypothetical protein
LRRTGGGGRRGLGLRRGELPGFVGDRIVLLARSRGFGRTFLESALGRIMASDRGQGGAPPPLVDGVARSVEVWC